LTLAGDGAEVGREDCVVRGDGCAEGAAGVEEGTTRLVGGSAGRGVALDCGLNLGLGGGSIDPYWLCCCGGGGAEALL